MLAFILFAFVASITPGPTNLIVLSTGARRGWRPCVPIVIGACAGAALVVWVAGKGAGGVLLTYPAARTAMTALGLGWMLWLAWQIFNAPVTPPATAVAEAKPELGLLGAALLQWINPKTWLMALAVVGVFTTQGLPLDQLCLTFFLVSIPCMSTWGLLGLGAARWLRHPQQRRWLNRILALLLVVSSSAALLCA
jgi:threonine/homoserine/homoserine lactone efflux protein